MPFRVYMYIYIYTSLGMKMRHSSDPVWSLNTGKWITGIFPSALVQWNLPLNHEGGRWWFKGLRTLPNTTTCPSHPSQGFLCTGDVSAFPFFCGKAGTCSQGFRGSREVEKICRLVGDVWLSNRGLFFKVAPFKQLGLAAWALFPSF